MRVSMSHSVIGPSLRLWAFHGPAEGVPLIQIVRDPVLFQIVKQVVDSGEEQRKRLQLSTPGMQSFEVHAAPLASTSSRGAIATLHDVTPTEKLETRQADLSPMCRMKSAPRWRHSRICRKHCWKAAWRISRPVESSGDIQANGVRLNNIAARLLTLSELESGRPAPNPARSH